ncbi:MAG: hypothetical protein ACO3JL_07170, partial [Myxococcota bacterium]
MTFVRVATVGRPAFFPKLVCSLGIPLLLLTGCPGPTDADGGDTPTRDAGQPAPRQLTLVQPLDGMVLTNSMDRDPATEGLQIAVRVRVDPRAAVSVRLVVDDGEPVAVEAVNGLAVFSDVTLTSSMEGIPHALRVEADGYEGDAADVVARYGDRAPRCEFLVPSDGTAAPPFSVVVSCDQVLPGQAGLLRVLDAGGVELGVGIEGLLDELLRFTAAGLTLIDGTYTLRFELPGFPESTVEQTVAVA